MKPSKTPVGPKLKSLINLCYNANNPFLLEGPTGIGKTDFVFQAAREMKIDTLVLDLTLMEPVDLIGLPEKGGGTVIYIPPELLPRNGRGILFLDELNRASKAMLSACMQLLSARRLNQYILPPGWLPAAAVNPQDSDDYDTNRFDNAMMARFVKIDVEPHVGNWAEWAEESDIHRAVIDYVTSTPKIFDSRMSNPRAWAKISALINAFEKGTFDQDVLRTAIAGCVGVELAVAFIRTMRIPKLAKIPSPENVINGYARVSSLIKDRAANGDTAFLEAICCRMGDHLQNPRNEAACKCSNTAMSNLFKFRAELPAEFKKKLDARAPWLANGGN